MLNVLTTLVVIVVMGALLVYRTSIAVWTMSYAALTFLIVAFASPGIMTKIGLVISLGLALTASIRPLRRLLFSQHLFHLARKALPTISKTEREALEAGIVGWEADLFSGSPDFTKLHKAPVVQLSHEEKAFLEGPVNDLCEMLDDWDITHNRADLPPEVWQFIKEKGFLGMIIPKQYGGLGFSATAQMAVLSTVYGCSVTAATTIAVPNSLGPAELLLKYGTKEQKDYYLPRLADGREIPCFALTGPNAGSDAASIPDHGTVCRQEVNGEEWLGVRVSWDKRYITLCPVATIIGLAFRLYDPDNILGKGSDVGITCALIPANTPGVIHGRRHFPLNSGFQNGPTQGKDVFIPISCLIGGASMAGQGWRMLMECLSAGRAISLPSSACGGSQISALGSGAYARVRRQFNQPIAKFEGIEEALARIGGYTYMIDAGLTMTVSAIDQGEKSAIAGAILKYHTTEFARQISLDAMDIHGGKGICLGPKNYLGRGYQGSPIAITVEGANILTRNLIIFGQGAIRCHPYVRKEIESVQNLDLHAFDKAVWAHLAFTLSNLTKSFVFGLTDAWFTAAPKGQTKRYYQLIHRYSSQLAFLADFSMLNLGGELKRKERISARLGDILSYIYLASAVLKRHHQDKQPVDDLPLVDWCCQQLFYNCEQAIADIIRNYNSRWARITLKLVLQPLGRKRQKPSDKLDHEIAHIVSTSNETRKRLTRFAYCKPVDNCSLGQLEEAFQMLSRVESIEKKILRAVKKGTLTSLTLLEQIDEARVKGLITKEEALQLAKAEQARQKVIAVDDFSAHDLARTLHEKAKGKRKSSAAVEDMIESILP